ncbi:MAG TPA: FtsX-like permease family protein [Catalimonadaceae bacterium]|nr:FtsX-like permease family protein [Catalimonadaceae bacterium]
MASSFLSGFIAGRLQFQKGSSFSATVIRISKISVALGIAILYVSVVIYAGFEQEIQKRMFSVGGQVSLRQFSTGTLYEEVALNTNDPYLKTLRQLPEVAHVQSFAFKPVLVSNEKEVAGIVLKGINPDFNLAAFQGNVDRPLKNTPKEGEIWISQRLARTLELKRGSEVVLFFMQEPPRYRKMKVTEIYQTGLEDVDETIAFVQLELIREINNWEPGKVGGFEVFVKDFQQFDFALDAIEKIIPYNMGTEPITLVQAQLFEWLDVIGRNVLVMFVLVAMVAGFNMAATLLIMVVERRKMVGVLKAMGADNGLIRKIFIRNGLKIMFQGMLWGNAIGLLLAFLQYQFELIPLDAENYYLSTVPIAWDWISIIGINIGVLFLSWLVILIPVRMVNRIQPAEAVK